VVSFRSVESVTPMIISGIAIVALVVVVAALLAATRRK
jgi:hypothetical protein